MVLGSFCKLIQTSKESYKVDVIIIIIIITPILQMKN